MNFWHLAPLIGCVLVVLTRLSDCKQLDDYIHHYEELLYDTDHVHSSHLRHRRSDGSSPLHLDIQAYDRTFRLRLKKDKTRFAPDFKLDFEGSLVSPDLSFLYSGTDLNIPGSEVHGAIIQGIFRGTIKEPNEGETYHIEKSYRFFDEKPVFHSVIYKESKMSLDPFKERRTRERREAKEMGTCGYTNAKQWMKSVVNSEVEPLNRAKRNEMNWQGVHTDNVNKYSYSSNNRENVHSRKKRSGTGCELGEQNSCFMSLTSDPFFWRRYLSKAEQDKDVARDEIIAFFDSHIKAINTIYQSTNFTTYPNTDETVEYCYTGVTFTVQKTKIMTDVDCTGTNALADFCQANVDVSNFLNMNSLINHDLFCLAYVFTYRDFSQGTLGLAWVGAQGRASGGVCEKNKKFTEGDKQIKKSLNTGICTIINYGKEVPSKVSQLTFAHEVGHNFGSPHDSGEVCAPYGTTQPDANSGNYIMFASATMGDKPHNSHFSICSKDNITRVLHSVINELSKKNCFQKSGPYCGNGIVEEGERCDCGFVDDCTDACCNARNSRADAPHMECQLRDGNCSPTEGPCCTKLCAFVSRNSSVCRYAEDCAAAQRCNGSSALCPPSDNKPDGNYCNNFGFTCKTGECAASLCERFGWIECFATGKSTTKEEQESLCTLGCKPNDTSTECILSSDTDKLVKYPDYRDMIQEVGRERKTNKEDKDKPFKGVQLAPGSPCNNFQGYCDVFYRCRGVDAEGPLARLKNLIFDPETLQDISNWIVEHWWAVLLMAVGLVLAMGLFIKFCAVHTPSSNPKAKPARKLSETMTLRRRRNQNRQAPPPQQVRYPQYQEKGRSHDGRSSDHHHDARSRDHYHGRDQELLHDPKYPAKNPQGPPPPYPGSSSSGAPVGPPHGHGKKGKGRKGKDMELGRI